MALSKRNRDKGVQSALKVLPPGTQVRTYVIGRGHARLTTSTIISMAVFAAVFVAALLAGYFILPGGLFLIYVFHSVRPPRGVVVSDQGLALLARSFWNGRPSQVLALLPPAPMGTNDVSGSVTVELGPERVTFSRAEFQQLAQATAGMVPPTGFAPGVPNGGAGGFPGGPSVTPQPFPSSFPTAPDSP